MQSEFKELALQVYVDGERKFTNELTEAEAKAALVAANHLAEYLKTKYGKPGEEEN